MLGPDRSLLALLAHLLERLRVHAQEERLHREVAADPERQGEDAECEDDPDRHEQCEQRLLPLLISQQLRVDEWGVDARHRLVRGAFRCGSRRVLRVGRGLGGVVTGFRAGIIGLVRFAGVGALAVLLGTAVVGSARSRGEVDRCERLVPRRSRRRARRS